ncbi:hypothetical protein GAR96_24455 [Salmonella enterica]|nr:hypothetical protein [Salmonella enterica]EGG4253471.1 hypothetical protein [Salmonella enterica]EGG4263300.1 hypothetical protein [Salmonella enterica]EGG4290132.1 hypothetical protein [Salmonella enterica]
MFNSICTFGGIDKCYSVIDFQKLPEKEIEKLRHSLVCPGCREQAFYRKKVLMVNRPALGPSTALAGKTRAHRNDKGKSEMPLKLIR